MKLYIKTFVVVDEEGEMNTAYSSVIFTQRYTLNRIYYKFVKRVRLRSDGGEHLLVLHSTRYQGLLLPFLTGV
jgi:hypothetical protein